ncbi:MAG: hypothetical protein ACFE95_07995, partial [Candidatus Hodarchaeota archaeon]
VDFVESLEEDLVRRDFSFNAIAFDPKNKQFIDKFSGIDDIRNNRLKVIGDAYLRFCEDGLRIIRLARFISQFKVTPEPKSLDAILKIRDTAQFRSSDALRIELFKLLNLSNPSSGLKLLLKAQIFYAIFPNFPFSKFPNTLLIEEGINRFYKIPQRQILIRLFGLLILLVDESLCTENSWLQIGENLNLTMKQKQIINRLYQSWTTFPSDLESSEFKRWVRQTGMNTSEDLLPLIFLRAEILGDSKFLAKKELIMNMVQKILIRFRGNADRE